MASLIEDGSVLQCGIGAIPDAILPNLMDRKDLGVHTEMISDNVIPLIEAGVINGRRKNLKPRKIILGFVLGTRKLFDFIDENPIFEFHPVGLHQRSFPHLAERSHGGHQLRHRSGPDRSGLRRVDWTAVLQRLRRAARLHPRRGALQVRQADHRAAVDRQGRHDLAHRAASGARRGRADRHAPTCTTWSPSTASPTCTGAPSASAPKRSSKLLIPSFAHELYEYCEQQRWFQRNAYEVEVRG